LVEKSKRDPIAELKGYSEAEMGAEGLRAGTEMG
jgi:hypothetical protein